MGGRTRGGAIRLTRAMSGRMGVPGHTMLPARAAARERTVRWIAQRMSRRARTQGASLRGDPEACTYRTRHARGRAWRLGGAGGRASKRHHHRPFLLDRRVRGDDRSLGRVCCIRTVRVVGRRRAGATRARRHVGTSRYVLCMGGGRDSHAATVGVRGRRRCSKTLPVGRHGRGVPSRCLGVGSRPLRVRRERSRDRRSLCRWSLAGGGLRSGRRRGGMGDRGRGFGCCVRRVVENRAGDGPSNVAYRGARPANAMGRRRSAVSIHYARSPVRRALLEYAIS